MNFARVLVIACLLVCAEASALDRSFTLSATSDYRYRGISQSAGDPALQGSLDFAFDSGFYVGAWASNVDFGEGEDAHVEIDWYAGYTWELSENVGLDFMFNYYTYPGYSESSDYFELIPSLYIGDFTFLFAWTGNYVNTGDSAKYFSADYNLELAENAGVFEGVTLDLHIGQSWGTYWDEWDIGSYTDYSVGVSANWGQADLSLAWLDNDVAKGETVSSGAWANNGTLLFTVSGTFEF